MDYSIGNGMKCPKNCGKPCDYVLQKSKRTENCLEDVCVHCGNIRNIIYLCEAIGYEGKPCEFREENAEEVCIHCGRVGSRILSTAQQKVFEYGDKDKLHADNGKHLGGSETTLSREAFTSNVSVLGAGFKARDRTKEGVERRSPKDAAIEVYRHKIEEYCTKIDLNGKSQESCMELFNEIAAKSENGISKNQSIPIILGVLFHGCKKGESHFTVKYLAKKTGEDEKTVRKGIKLVEKKCQVSSAEKLKVESGSLIESLCLQLGMDKSFRTSFALNAKTVDDRIHGYLDGKRPTTVAATSIFLTLKWFHPSDTRWPLASIAKTVGVSVAALTSSVKKVENDMERDGCTSEDIVKEVNSLCRSAAITLY